MIDKISKKILVENGISKIDVLEFKNLDGEFSCNLKTAMDLAYDKINNEALSEVKKLEIDNTIKKNIKYSLMLDFIIESNKDAIKEGIAIGEYLNELKTSYNRGLTRARSISCVIVTLISLLYLVLRFISMPQEYPVTVVRLFAFLALVTLMFAYWVNEAVKKGIKSEINLIKESIDELSITKIIK